MIAIETFFTAYAPHECNMIEIYFKKMALFQALFSIYICLVSLPIVYYKNKKQQIEAEQLSIAF